MENLNVELVPIEKLIPYANNARKHSGAQVDQIAASIKEFGFVNPVLVDGGNGVIAGHGRLLAAKKLGLTTVPTIELAHLSPVQKKAYILADNRIAENASWDQEILTLELEALKISEFDVGLIGFDAESQNVNEPEKEEPRQPFGDSRDTEAVDLLLNRYETVVCQFSGDKDSIAMALFLREIVPEKLRLVWAKVPLFDWGDAESYIEKTAETLGIPLTICERDKSESDCFDKLKKRGYPGHGMKWCNSDYKVAPSDKALKNFKLPIVCMGVRSEESSRRAAMLARGKWGKKDFIYPIFEWSTKDVLERIAKAGVKLHRSYHHFNRFSCSCCFLQSKQDWATMRKYYPDEFGKALKNIAQASKCEKYRYANNALETLLDNISGGDCNPDEFEGCI